MKNNLDILAVAFGITASFLKAIKNKLKIRAILIAAIVGGILSYGTLGVMDMLFTDLEPRVIMLIAFSVGWVANELTDVLDNVVKDGYDIVHEWVKGWFKKK